MLEPGKVRREIERAIRILRTGRAEQRLALTLAVGLLAFSYFASTEQVPLIPQGWAYFFLWANGAMVVGAFLWLARLFWKKAYVSRAGLQEDFGKPLPTAIKGALSFGPADGALFRQLERGPELAELLGYVADDQIPLVCVMGESGAGKTSLLRSGLAHELKQNGIPTAYWEAVPTDSLPRLLRAIEATAKTSFDPKKISQHGPLAVVVDQLEQLDPEKPSCREVFEFLRRVSTGFPPHRVTWIVAFRRDYLPIWRDFELSNGVNPPTLSLRHLTQRQAHNVMVVLGEAVGLTFDRSLLDSFVRTAAHQDRVPPVYVGVGMLVLTRLAKRTGKAHLTLDDYKLAEESGGLLTQYLQECLGRFLDSERSGILQVLRKLVDFEENKRVAEGLSLDQLAQDSPLTPANLKACLEHLSSSNVRLLELVGEDSERYRVPHDTFVPAIRALCGELLAEEEKAVLDFEAGFRAWLNNGEKAQYLLTGRRLLAASRYSGMLLVRGNTSESRSRYLRLSLRHRSQRRAALFVVALAIIGILVGLFHAKEAEGYRTALSSWGLPAALYEAQDHLMALQIHDFPLTNLEWLKGSIKELALRGTHLGSFVGLPGSLETLTVEVTSSNMSTFAELEKLSSLRTLTLELSGWAGWGWPVVRNLESLRELKIAAHATRVTSFPELENLPSLQTLTLEMWGPGAANLPQLEKLTSLQALSLDGGSLGVLDWTELEKLTRLQTLTLGTVIRTTPRGARRPEESTQNFPNLGKLPSLQTLTLLNLSSLPELTKATSLRTLTLHVNSSLEDWSELEDLTWLETLTLHVDDPDLTRWPDLERIGSLKKLVLYMRGSKTPSLPRLENLTSIQTLSLNLFDSKVSNLPNLDKLTSLRSLDLVVGQSGVSRLPELNHPTSLQVLKLDVSQSSVRTLPELHELTSLETLDLSVRSSEVRNLPDLAMLGSLRALTLNASYSEIPGLPSLQGLSSLQTLTLDVSGSRVADWPRLENLPSLQTLNLHVGYRGNSRLPALDGITSLRNLTLNVYGSQVWSWPELGKLTSLETLTMSVKESAQSNLAELEGLPALKTLILDVENSHVASLPHLAGLTSLQTLRLVTRGSQVLSLPALEKLTSLETLSIEGRAAGISAFPNSLRKLRLARQGRWFP